jgi:hypothetical protein
MALKFCSEDWVLRKGDNRAWKHQNEICKTLITTVSIKLATALAANGQNKHTGIQAQQEEKRRMPEEEMEGPTVRNRHYG